MPKETAGAWILGVIMALLALIGLIMASTAVEPIFYGTGLALSAFGVIFILIKQNNEVPRPPR